MEALLGAQLRAEDSLQPTVIDPGVLAGMPMPFVHPERAAYSGNNRAAELLLTYHADVSARRKADNTFLDDGGTPLHLAALSGSKYIAELLLTHKADVNAKTKNGTTPLHVALQYSHDDVAELLRQHGRHE